MRLALLIALVAACAHPRPAPPPPSKAGAQVMILGTYHFDNPGLDAIKTDLDDHTTPARQAQIARVVDALAAFRPTIIMVEARDQAALTAAYDAYRAGAPLDPSEVQQLGFRLAGQLGLARVVAIDSPAEMDFDRLLAVAQASNDRTFLDAFAAATAEVQAALEQQPHRTVAENLRALDAPAWLAMQHDVYLWMTRVKAGDDFAGADVVAGWYQRNFRIFANLAAAVTSPDDRVLVVFGAGHASLLRELVAASPNLVLVDPASYLP